MNEAVELDNGKVYITEEGMVNFEKVLMERRVTDKQAKEFSEMIAGLKHL